jgi:hypothetical protein
MVQRSPTLTPTPAERPSLPRRQASTHLVAACPVVPALHWGCTHDATTAVSRMPSRIGWPPCSHEAGADPRPVLVCGPCAPSALSQSSC